MTRAGGSRAGIGKSKRDASFSNADQKSGVLHSYTQGANGVQADATADGANILKIALLFFGMKNGQFSVRYADFSQICKKGRNMCEQRMSKTVNDW